MSASRMAMEWVREQAARGIRVEWAEGEERTDSLPMALLPVDACCVFRMGQRRRVSFSVKWLRDGKPWLERLA